MPLMRDTNEGGGEGFQNPPESREGFRAIVVRLDYTGKHEGTNQKNERIVQPKIAITVELHPDDAGVMTDGTAFSMVRNETVSTYGQSCLRSYLDWFRPDLDDDFYKKTGLAFVDIQEILVGECVMVPVKITTKGEKETAWAQRFTYANPKFIQGHEVRGDYREAGGLVEWLRSRALDKASEPWIEIESETSVFNETPKNADSEPATSAEDRAATSAPATIEFDNQF